MPSVWRKINTVEELSIEHKTPWLNSNNPKELYFDLNNIAFSHLSCNIGARRNKETKHPSVYAYLKGCRCLECTKLNSDKQKKRREK